MSQQGKLSPPTTGKSAQYAQHFIKYRPPSKVLTDFKKGEYRVWDIDDLWRFEYWVAEDQWYQSEFVEVGKKLAEATSTKLDKEPTTNLDELDQEPATELDQDSKQVETSFSDETNNSAGYAMLLLVIGVFAHWLF